MTQISVDGVDIPNGSGGGADRHTFGVGGALCGLSTCYRVSFVTFYISSCVLFIGDVAMVQLLVLNMYYTP